jgi:hypothetical protein
MAAHGDGFRNRRDGDTFDEDSGAGEYLAAFRMSVSEGLLKTIGGRRWV